MNIGPPRGRVTSIATQADRVLGWLAKHRRPVVSLLRPGLTDQAIHALATQLDWPLPSDAVDLFRWRNGTRKPSECILDEVYFFPGYYLMSLEDAVEQMPGYVNEAVWQPKWLPLFTNDAGDFMLLDCERCTPQGCPVIWFLRGEPQVWDAYDSLSAMMETLSAGFESGAIFEDEAGFLEMDQQRYATIAKRLNPRSRLWANLAQSQ